MVTTVHNNNNVVLRVKAIVQDLHPHDRGPQRTHHGAIIANGMPVLPGHAETAAGTRAAAPKEQAAAHDAQTAELAKHKLGPVTADDADSYRRVACPAAAGKIRCPLRPASMKLDRARPERPSPYHRLLKRYFTAGQRPDLEQRKLRRALAILRPTLTSTN